jgi:hypothetical protein
MCTFSCPAVNHRIFVLAGDLHPTRVCPTPLTNSLSMACTSSTPRGQLYMIYNCWDSAYSGWPANLCITHLENSWTRRLEPRRQPHHLRAGPTVGAGAVRGMRGRFVTNECPQQMVNRATDQNFRDTLRGAGEHDILLSGGCWSSSGMTPMQYQNWRKDTGRCVFFSESRGRDPWGGAMRASPRARMVSERFMWCIIRRRRRTRRVCSSTIAGKSVPFFSSLLLFFGSKWVAG